MNEELTNEVLEAMKMCKHVCALCGANEACGNYSWQYTIQTLATALLEERAKPKVWDGAPDEAGRAAVTFYGNSRLRGTREYHRELPKTRIDEIIDESLDGWLFEMRMGKSEMREILESALNKYAEELTNTKETQ
jgi:hypothetical protein